MAIRWKVHRGLGAPLGCPYKARVPVKVAGGPYGPPSAGFDPETARHASEALPVGATGRTVAAHRGLRRAGFAESSRWASTLPHFTLASRRQHGRIAVVTTSYGAWSSPIRAADVADGVSLTFPQLVPVDEGASEVWWTESRPAESGRQVVVCRAADGMVHDVLPAPRATHALRLHVPGLVALRARAVAANPRRHAAMGA